MNKAYAIVGFEQRPLGNPPFVVEWIFLSGFPSNITFLNRVIYFFLSVTTRVHLRHLHAIDNASLVYERRIEIVLEKFD